MNNNSIEHINRIEAINRIIPNHLNSLESSKASLRETLERLISRVDLESAAINEQHYANYLNDARRCSSEALQLIVRELHGLSHVLNQSLEAQVECFRITQSNAEALSQCLSLKAEQTACSMLQRICPRQTAPSYMQKAPSGATSEWDPKIIQGLDINALDTLGTPLPASLDIRIAPQTMGSMSEGSSLFSGTLNASSLPNINTGTSKRGTISSFIGTKKSRTSKIKSGRIISQPSIVSSTNGIANSLNALNLYASPIGNASNSSLGSGSSLSTSSLRDSPSPVSMNADLKNDQSPAISGFKLFGHVASNQPKAKSPLANAAFGNSPASSSDSLVQARAENIVAVPLTQTEKQVSQNTAILIADFQAADENELECKEGEQVRILSSDGGNGWTFCETLDSKKRGLVPTSYLNSS